MNRESPAFAATAELINTHTQPAIKIGTHKICLLQQQIHFFFQTAFSPMLYHHTILKLSRQGNIPFPAVLQLFHCRVMSQNRVRSIKGVVERCSVFVLNSDQPRFTRYYSFVYAFASSIWRMRLALHLSYHRLCIPAYIIYLVELQIKCTSDYMLSNLNPPCCLMFLSNRPFCLLPIWKVCQIHKIANCCYWTLA